MAMSDLGNSDLFNVFQGSWDSIRLRLPFQFHEPSTDASVPFRMVGRFTLSCSAARSVGALALFRMFPSFGQHPTSTFLGFAVEI